MRSNLQFKTDAGDAKIEVHRTIVLLPETLQAEHLNLPSTVLNPSNPHLCTAATCLPGHMLTLVIT